MGARLSNWGRQTLGGIVWATLTFVASRATTLLITLVLARLLTPADFGVVAAITVFLSLLELASDLGMKATVIYEQERAFTRRVDTAFTLNLLLALALTAIAGLLSPLVAGFFGLKEETDLFRLASLSLLIVGLGNIHDALLLRSMQLRRRAVAELGRLLSRGVVAIALAVAGLGAEALVLGILAGNAAWSALQWGLTHYRPRLVVDRAIARSMIGYGTGAVALEVLAVVSNRIDAIAIGRVLGPAPLGIYTIASRLPELVIESVAWNLSTVMFPALSRKHADEPQRLAVTTLRVLRYQALFALPVGAAMAVLAPPLVVALFSERWEAAGPVMSGLAVMSAIQMAVFPLGDALKAAGRQRLLAVVSLAELPILVAGVVLGVGSGLVVVAWVRVGVMALHAILMGAVAVHELQLRPSSLLAAVAPAVVTAIGVAAATAAVRLAWPDMAVIPLVAAGTLVGLLAGLVTLRLAAPLALAELRRLVGQLRA